MFSNNFSSKNRAIYLDKLDINIYIHLQYNYLYVEFYPRNDTIFINKKHNIFKS